MSRRFRTTAIAVAVLAAASSLASAQGMDPMQAAVKARQSHMFLYQFNLMALGGMAQGAVPYDAAVASAAAANLAALADVDQSRYWPAGTSHDEMGAAVDTDALPAIWADPEDFAARRATLSTAAQAMVTAAGTDLAALQGAMQGLGQACGGCHETYRLRDD